ncbi:MAG: hypothetical protein U0325_33490 [Polyangiales bacterium]
MTASSWPFFVSAGLGLVESLALTTGQRWAFRLGVPVSRYTETLPFELPDVLPTMDSQAVRVVALGDGRVGFLHASSEGLRGSSGGASVRSSGVLCYGVIQVERQAGATTLRLDGRVAWFPIASWLGLVASLWMSLRADPDAASTVAKVSALFGVFMLASVAWSYRDLQPTFHILTANLAARSAHALADSPPPR